MNQLALALLIAALSSGAQAQAVADEKAAAELTEQLSERVCLAQALYYEARGEGERGQRAVAEVVFDRMKESYRPDTICGVVFEKWQFSFTFDGSMRRRVDYGAWDQAMVLAEKIMSESPLKKRILPHGTTYFARWDVDAPWIVNMNVVTQIGDHVFYRLKPAAERVKLTRVAAR